MDLVLREVFLVRVFDCHICRLYPGVYIRGVRGGILRCVVRHRDVRYRTTEWAVLASRDVTICTDARHPQYRSG